MVGCSKVAEEKVRLRTVEEKKEFLLVGGRGGETVKVSLNREQVLLLLEERVALRFVIEGGRKRNGRRRESPLDVAEERVVRLEEQNVGGRVDADESRLVVHAHLEKWLFDGEDLTEREEGVEVGGRSLSDREMIEVDTLPVCSAR